MNKTVKQVLALPKTQKDEFSRFLQYMAPGKKKIHRILEVIFEHERSGQPDSNPISPAILDKYQIRPSSLPRLLTQLGQLLNAYFAHLELQQTPSLEHVLSLRYQRRHHANWSDSFFKKSVKHVQEEPEEANRYLYHYWLLREELENRAASINRGKQYLLLEAMQEAGDLLTRFFALQKALEINEQSSLAQVKKVVGSPSQKPDQVGEATQRIMQSKEGDWPLLRFLQQMHRDAQTPEELKTLIIEFRKLQAVVSETLWIDLWARLHNLATKLVNQEGAESLAFELYQLWLKRFHLPTSEKTATPHHRPEFLKNYTELGCRIGLPDQILHLLDQIEPHSEGKEADMIQFCRAIVDFSQRDFESSLQRLNRLDAHSALSDLFFRIGMRFLRLKTLFELADWSEFESSLLSLQQFCLKNKDLPEYHREIFIDRINLFKRLLRAYTGTNPQIDRLIEDLADHQVKDRQWMLEKAMQKRATR